MGFTVFCDIKDKTTGTRCRKQVEPLLNKNTNEIYCPCGNKLEDQSILTDFAKRQMVQLGQVLKEDQNKQSYAVKCSRCEETKRPNLKNNKLFCSECGEELTQLSPPYANMLKQQLRTLSV